jgi:hypothetical protein
VFLFCGTQEEQKAWDNMPEDDRNKAYEAVMNWFAENGSKVSGGYQLQDPSTATTVRKGPDRQPIVTDGPYIEGNEVIGGFTEVEVDNLDEALRMVKTWPAGAVEIRPVVER